MGTFQRWKVSIRLSRLESPRKENEMPPNPSSSFDNRLIRVELAVSRIEEQIAQLVSDMSELKDVLYGEHGKSGLVSQGEHLQELEKALKGYGREPGLIADIKNLMVKMAEFDDNRKWLTRLIVGAIVTDIVVHFIQMPH